MEIEIAKFQPVKQYGSEIEHAEAIWRLRAALEDINGLICPLHDNSFLLRFLRAKKYRVNDALKMILNYYEHRRQNNDVFSSVCQSTLKSIYEGNKGALMVLKERDSLGRKILLVRMRLWNLTDFDFNQRIMLLYFIMEELIYSEETQKNGIITIEDHGGLGLNHVRKTISELTLKRIQMIIKFFQGSFPIRYKASHIINNQYAFGVLYGLIKPFLNAKYRQRVHIHGKNLDSLHEIISPKILPKSFGGALTEDEAEDHDLMNSIFNKGSYYKGTFEFGFTNKIIHS